MKKIISIVVAVMVLSLAMAMTFSVLAAAPAGKLTANKTTAKVNDEITLTFEVSGADNQQTGGFEVTIGDGLEYVAGSGQMLVQNATLASFNETNKQGAFLYMSPSNINGNFASLKVKVLATGTNRTVTAKAVLSTTSQEASDSVTIAIAPESVTVSPKTVTLDLASQTTTANVTVTVAPPAATPDIVASTSNAKVATVSGSTISAVGKGTATITFTQKGTTLKDTVTVTVTCSHNWEEKVTDAAKVSAADCKTPATYKKTCSVCGELSNDTFNYGNPNPDNHVGPIVTEGAKAATHFEDGFTGNKVCQACKNVTEQGQPITKIAHTWGTTYEHDENQHWQKCTEDDATTEKTNHTAGDWEIVEAADIGKAGKMVKKCTVCGYEMATETIPALKDYTDTKTAEYKEEAPADVVINTKDGATAAPTAVTIGDKVLREGTDYTVDGNKITIKQDFLKTLDNGSYNVEVTFADGVARAALTVTKATPVATTPATQASNVPATGIESHLGLWIALLVLAASGIAVISFRKKESK